MKPALDSECTTETQRTHFIYVLTFPQTRLSLIIIPQCLFAFSSLHAAL